MTGPTGADGSDGATGATGPTGPGGGALTAWGYAARIGGASVSVDVSGTLVPLPNAHNLNGVTVDAGFTDFTIGSSGTYEVAYFLSLGPETVDDANPMSARILRNGTADPALVDRPLWWVPDLNGFAIVDLVAGDVLSLELYNKTGTTSFSQGPMLSIKRIA